MIDLVSEAESIYSEFSVRGYWVSSCWKHTHMCYCMASRDTMPGLHLAEHKWVKRNYNKEQSSLLTPPGTYRLLQSAPALFTPLGMLSTSQTHLPVCSNGVGHQALLTMGGKRETSIDLKMSCSVIFKSFRLYFFLSLCWQSASGHGSGVYRMFCDQFFSLYPRVCVYSCMYQVLSAVEYIRGGRRVIYLTKCSQ